MKLVKNMLIMMFLLLAGTLMVMSGNVIIKNGEMNVTQDLYVTGTFKTVKETDTTSSIEYNKNGEFIYHLLGFNKFYIKNSETFAEVLRTPFLKIGEGNERVDISADMYDLVIKLNDAGMFEKFRITRRGNVGIGVSDPKTLLHVNGSIAATSFCDSNGENCVDHDRLMTTPDTITYTGESLKLYTTTGAKLPILVTRAATKDRPTVAAALCSKISGGAYPLGIIKKFGGINSGYIHDTTVPGSQRYRCEDSCITGLSGNKYAWYHIDDFLKSGDYWNSNNPNSYHANNPEVETKTCGEFDAGGMGKRIINGECMADAQSSRASHSGMDRPNYHWGNLVIEELLCWRY